MLHFDILEDLSDDLELCDYFHFLSINDLTYELNYRSNKRIEYYLMINKNPLIIAEIFNDIDACRILYKRGYRSLSVVMMNACKKGNLDIIKWVYDEIDVCCFNVLECACSNRQIHIMNWLHQRGIRLQNSSSFGYAWSNKNKYGSDVFKWLYTNERDMMMNWLRKCSFRSEVVEWLRAHCGYIDE